MDTKLVRQVCVRALARVRAIAWFTVFIELCDWCDRMTGFLLDEMILAFAVRVGQRLQFRGEWLVVADVQRHPGLNAVLVKFTSHHDYVRFAMDEKVRVQDVKGFPV